MSTRSPSPGDDSPDKVRDVTETSPPRMPAHLAPLVDRARDYIKASSAENTRRAYGADWRHYSVWCRRQSLDPLPPDVQTMGLYTTACAAGVAVAISSSRSPRASRASARPWRSA